MAYDVIEPFGDFRNNWHAALIAHIIAAAFTSSKRKPPTMLDFMWKDAQTRREESEAETLSWLRSMKRG